MFAKRKVEEEFWVARDLAYLPGPELHQLAWLWGTWGVFGEQGAEVRVIKVRKLSNTLSLCPDPEPSEPLLSSMTPPGLMRRNNSCTRMQ